MLCRDGRWGVAVGKLVELAGGIGILFICLRLVSILDWSY